MDAEEGLAGSGQAGEAVKDLNGKSSILVAQSTINVIKQGGCGEGKGFKIHFCALSQYYFSYLKYSN